MLQQASLSTEPLCQPLNFVIVRFLVTFCFLCFFSFFFSIFFVFVFIWFCLRTWQSVLLQNRFYFFEAWFIRIEKEKSRVVNLWIFKLFSKISFVIEVELHHFPLLPSLFYSQTPSLRTVHALFMYSYPDNLSLSLFTIVTYVCAYMYILYMYSWKYMYMYILNTNIHIFTHI